MELFEVRAKSRDAAARNWTLPGRMGETLSRPDDDN
jgi:hypothetical protein